ncbi:MAG TPA: hypothetical protein VGQ08_17020 [Nitrospiraceae bacterium]|jgi:hypothetical protein|nr:hypothetical protein [Nitrospiraceae bacterium]
MNVCFDKIPDELKARDQWVAWLRETCNGKLTKVPYQANKIGVKASVTDPTTWAAFEEALAASPKYNGVGYVLTSDDPYTGIDLDLCLDPATGKMDPWALAIVDQIHSYTEISPSGEGVRIFVRGSLPPTGRKKGMPLAARHTSPYGKKPALELYETGRYLTVTGNHLPGTPLTIENRHAVLQLVHAAHFPPTGNGNGDGHQKARPITADDETQLARMFASKNGAKIKRLYDGDFGEYPSQSEADAALCCYLAYWFAHNRDRMDRLFRQSKLMRPKWDSRRGDTTYGGWTIAAACDLVKETYQEPTSHTDTPEPAPEPDAPFTILTAPTSFISRYVTYATTRTDAPPEAHEALAFGILSVLASNVRLPIATSPRGWSLVLWIIYLVNSTAGRKSTTLDLAVDLLCLIIGTKAILSWEGSPQGFIQRLQERDGQANVFVRDEYSSLIAAFNKNGHLSGLPQVLIKAFDGSPLENIRTKKKGADGLKHSDSDRVERPFLAQFAAAPWDAFVQRATIDNVLDGFLARFIVITGAAAGRELPLLTPSITEAQTALYEQAKAYGLRAQSLTKVIIAPEVMTAQWALEQDFLKQAAASVQPDAAGPSLKRLAETALKVAALLALEEATGGVLSIQEAHFTLARCIVARWAKPAVRLVEALGASTFQRDCARVWQTIHHRTVVTRSALYRPHRRLRKREFDEILEALEMQGRIRIDETKESGAKGRPAYTIQPVGGEL